MMTKGLTGNGTIICNSRRDDHVFPNMEATNSQSVASFQWNFTIARRNY